ncbi:MAG: hypothetical protein J6U13_11265 [Salinivirgaceae bacterium]|nr:hypothetical protein [Salinivirgaceae bacterium]
MQTKNLIKIIKAESTVLESMIENLPDDGNVQSYEVELLINKIQALNDIAVHLLPEGQNTAETNIDAEVEKYRKYAEDAQKAGEEKSEHAARLSGKSWISALSKKVDEDSAAKKFAEAEAARKVAEELASKAEAEEQARKQAEAEEEARKAAEAEAEAARQAAEALARKQAEEDAARKAAEEEARRAAEAEEARKAAEEAARKAEEDAKKTKSLAEELADNTINVEHTFAESDNQAKETETKQTIQQEQPATLADKFQQHVPSINDVLAGLEKKADIASRYNKRPITNLRKAIKINDRLLFINELFNHDSVQYEQTIDMIEGASGIDEVLAKIFSQYQWNQEDKTVIDFLELIYQRFKK